MNLYNKKQRWKLALLGVATIMVAASLWFSFQIVRKVQNKEVDRVQQWADAVKRKSELVNLTNTAFDELSNTIEEMRERDRQKAEMLSLAINEVNKPLDDYSFVLKVMQENGGVPMILTDMDENIVDQHNIEWVFEAIENQVEIDHPNFSETLRDSVCEQIKNDSLKSFLAFWRTKREPIVIDIFDGDQQKVFYFDSTYYRTIKLQELQRNRDSLSQAFTSELIENENLVPVMFIDKGSREVIATNIPEYDSTNTAAIIKDLASKNDSKEVNLGDLKEGVIYFEYSAEITQMKYFSICTILYYWSFCAHCLYRV